MVERNNGEVANYREDGEARALYYWPYRETYERVKQGLIVGHMVPSDLEIMYVGNNSLLPTCFDLRNRDREPLEETVLPGKSAHIAFSRDMSVICGALFDRPCRRTDHAYIIKAQELIDLGFIPIYVPLPNTPLHLRVVHQTHIGDPNARDIPFKAKKQLVDALRDKKIT